MDFFNSLALDLKMLVVAIAGCALLALFSGNRKSEKRYMVVLALLTAAGVYRFARVQAEDELARNATQSRVPHVVTAPPKHVPLVSTSATK
jgi:hypothetical protein